jgi:hypothetical protein
MGVKRSEHYANHVPPMWLRTCEPCFNTLDRLILYSVRHIPCTLHGPTIRRLASKTHLTSCSSDSVGIHWPPASCLPISTRIFPPSHMHNDIIYLFQMTCLFTAYLCWHTNKKAFYRLDSVIQVVCPVYIQIVFFAGTLHVFLDAISSARSGAVRYIPGALSVSARLSVLRRRVKSYKISTAKYITNCILARKRC